MKAPFYLLRLLQRQSARPVKKLERRPTELLISAVALALLVAMSRGVILESPPAVEISSFRAINELPNWLFPIIWPFMQYGVFVTIPIVAAIAFYFKKYRLATLLLIGGVGIYYLALFVKDLVPRGRPGELLDGVIMREHFAPGSSGFTSGHTAVAGTIATFAHYYLSRKWQILSITTLLIVAFGRMYIGGHLPLDVLGGVALGTAVASLLNFVAGVPVAAKPRIEETRAWIVQHRPRHPGDIIRMILAAFFFTLATFLALTGHISGIEESIFRLVNSLPAYLSPVLQGLMQTGALYFVFIASAAALLFKHKRLSVKILFGGVLVWWLTKLAKLLVDRDRPFYILSEITQRAQNSGILGFPSGHAAVAALIATVSSPYLPRKWRRAVWVIAWTVALSRMYVGAHFPLDIIAGLSIGWFFGSLLNIAFGTPRESIPYGDIKATLNEAGMPLASLDDAAVDARGSAPLYGTTKSKRNVFIKFIDNEQRNADILYRLWRHLTLRGVEDDAPFASAKQSIEHEAYLSIQASNAGVTTPEVLLAAPVTHSAAVLVTQKVAGKTLNHYKGELGEELLSKIWREVVKLHKKRIAHRDLRAANILIDRHKQPWIIDFSFAKTAASNTQLNKDLVELLTSLSMVTSPKIAVRTAIKALGKDSITIVQPYLQPLALSPATRKGLKKHPDLIDQILAEIQTQADAHRVKPVRMSRISYRWLVLLGIIAAAIYYFLPRLGELDGTWDVIQKADLKWLFAALVASVASYLAAALVVIGSTRKALPFLVTLVVQTATSFVNRITPKSLGGIVLLERYLEKFGHSRIESTAAVSLLYGAGILVHIFLLAVVIFRINPNTFNLVELSQEQIILLFVITVLLALGLILTSRFAGLISKWGKEIARSIRHIFTTPAKFLQLMGGSAAVTLAYAFALYCSLEAFGSSVPFGTLLFVYLVGSAVASASPTPGGLGATEAALAVGLSSTGTPIGQAIAGVLLFRLITFWLPILPGFLAFRYTVKNKII